MSASVTKRQQLAVGIAFLAVGAFGFEPALGAPAAIGLVGTLRNYALRAEPADMLQQPVAADVEVVAIANASAVAARRKQIGQDTLAFS